MCSEMTLCRLWETSFFYLIRQEFKVFWCNRWVVGQKENRLVPRQCLLHFGNVNIRWYAPVHLDGWFMKDRSVNAYSNIRLKFSGQKSCLLWASICLSSIYLSAIYFHLTLWWYWIAYNKKTNDIGRCKQKRDLGW